MENAQEDVEGDQEEVSVIDEAEVEARRAEENARLLAEDKLRKEARAKARKQSKIDRDARGMKKTPHGSFSFRAESIKLNLKEGANVDRISVSFGLITQDKNLPNWWDAPKAVCASLDKKGIVTFDRVCLGTTKQFPLTEAFLSPILAMKITISISEMLKEIPDSSDPILGTITIELAKLLVEDRPELKLSEKLMRTNNKNCNLSEDNISLAEIKLTCDDDLAEYVLGGCILNCGPLNFTNPPTSWTLEGIDPNSISGEEEGQTPQARSPAMIKSMMADGKLNQTFSLSIPPNSSLLPSLQFELGTMIYEPPLPPELKTKTNSNEAYPNDDEGEKGGGTSTPLGGSGGSTHILSNKGTWTLIFKSSLRYFLKRQTLASLHKAVSEGENIEFLLTRNKLKGTLSTVQQTEDGVEEVFKPEEPWSVLLTSNIQELLIADIKSCYAINEITQAPINLSKPITGISKSKAKELFSNRNKEVAAVLNCQDLENRFKCEFPISLSRSFKQSTIEVECETLTIDDVVPPRRKLPKKPPRKFEDELKGELMEMVRSVCAEYEVLFNSGPIKLNKRNLTVRQQGEQLLQVLHTAGVRHDFMERLKPVVQRAVIVRFGRGPCDEAEKDKYLSELYSWLMNCVSQMLVKIYAPMVSEEQEEITRHRLEHKASITASLQQSIKQHSSLHNIKEDQPDCGGSKQGVGQMDGSHEVAVMLEQLEDLRIVSLDLEAMDDWKSAMIKNEDRVTEAVNWLVTNPEQTGTTSDVWFSFGEFYLRAAIHQGPSSPTFSELIGKAVEALKEASKLNGRNAKILKLLGSILLEQGRYEEAGEILMDAFDLESPCVNGTTASSTPAAAASSRASRTLAQMAEPEPLTSTLICLYYNVIGDYTKAGEYLGHSVRSFNSKGFEAPGKPRRTASLLALEAANYLVEAALPGLAQLALELADKAEAASIAKAAGIVKTRPTPGNAATRKAAAKQAAIEAAEKVKAEGGEGSEPTSIIQQRLCVSVKIALLKGNLTDALPYAEQATICDPRDSEAWRLLGDVRYAGGSGEREAAVLAYSKAVLILDSIEPPPLKLLVRLGSLYLNLGKYEDAKQTYLMGAGSWQTCSMWLGVGIALLRLENYGEAECAFQEANIRNNRSAAVWGYMCLLCLNTGSARLTQADHARSVAERLGLSDATLLRELGNVYTSLDRLETAEGLFRRSLAVDENNSHTRRRLADALSAQNAVADAVNEYLRVIETYKENKSSSSLTNYASSSSSSSEEKNKKEEEDRKECLLAITQCEQLLKTLGRMEEFAPLRALQGDLMRR